MDTIQNSFQNPFYDGFYRILLFEFLRSSQGHNMPMRISQLLNIQYPIIQAGMVWCSGWELASASANADMLGVIGSGSMYPDILDHHIKKCQAATQKPFGVNVPLLYPDIDMHFEVILSNGIKTVITSAGNPAKYTALLKKEGITVLHVVSSSKFALKAQDAGVDAVIAEGFEAGGHNGREETTTLCLVPQVCQAVHIPVVAAGGISSGKSMFAALALGADGVQIGSRFVVSNESSAHLSFKQKVIDAAEGDTILTLKELAPVRLIKNDFYSALTSAYANGAESQELRELLDRGRAKKGMFEGDLKNGELEIGQVSASINEMEPVAEIVKDIISEYEETRALMNARSMSL
ncbi:MAG: enoyl-[acyl-carrier protein] reductase II [Cryomorphaceae bacterium]|jgi:enoyl-[acyl-carrier protein] reductase II